MAGLDFTLGGDVMVKDNHIAFSAGYAICDNFDLNSLLIRSGGEITVEILFTRLASGRAPVFDCVGSGGCGVRLDKKTDDTYTLYFTYNSSGTLKGRDFTMLIGETCLITTVLNSKSLKIYKNGILIASASDGLYNRGITYNRPLVIGGSADASGTVTTVGLNDDVYAMRLYERMLTVDEILINFNKDKERFGLDI